MSGGKYYRYYCTPAAGGRVNGVNLPGNTEYVRVRDYKTQSGSYDVESTAFYLEDNWQISDRFLAYLGVRSKASTTKTAPA